MEEQKKRKEHKELTRKHRTKRESLKKRETLKRQMNKERLQRKGNMREKCEITHQIVCGKTEKSLHIRHISTVHVALNKSNINSS